MNSRQGETLLDDNNDDDDQGKHGEALPDFFKSNYLHATPIVMKTIITSDSCEKSDI
jgi:hypothetical protein